MTGDPMSPGGSATPVAEEAGRKDSTMATDTIQETPAVEAEQAEQAVSPQLAAARQALDEAREAHSQSTQRRVALERRAGEVEAELEATAKDLVESRKAAVLGDDGASERIGSLVGRQRSLTAERDELVERIAVAMDMEAEAQAAHQRLRLQERAETNQQRALQLRARAIELDAAIDQAIREVMWPLLAERKAISTEAYDTKVKGIVPGYADALDRAIYHPEHVPALAAGQGPRPRVNLNL
jgi:chromosome segregation ATPase